jgi:hypothetical protein
MAIVSLWYRFGANRPIAAVPRKAHAGFAAVGKTWVAAKSNGWLKRPSEA